jgi:DNA primase
MDQATEIREKIDIVSYISEFITLKKMGRNFKANCPFHNENTPSFVVSPERQIWHCFGCQKGGDAFSFLMEYENMEFSEAIRVLAKKTGVTLKETNFNKTQYSEKERIFELNNLALKFYHYLLTEHAAGKVALSYLKDKRKITDKIINTYQLGFAPSSGTALSAYLIKKKGYKSNDLFIAGLSFQKDGRIFDFFRDRIIFPLYDHRGNVTGFSARALDERNLPKYINTKETAVYHKGSMFFGLNSAKEEIKKKQDALIVEGEFDAISLFMEGISNAVAIKGTALTEGQVNLLARFTPKVTLCLDQDSAGFEATKRSLEVIEKKGLSTSIVVFPEGKDPDEALKSNPAEFKKAVRESVGIYDYLLNVFLSKNNKETAEGKKIITDTLLPLFNNISNEIIKEHFLKKLSSEIDVSLESLNREMEKLQKHEDKEKVIISKKDKRSRRQLIEEYLLALILQSEQQKEIFIKAKDSLVSYEFEIPSLGKIFVNLADYFAKKEKFDHQEFSQYLDRELIRSFDECFLFPLPKFTSQAKAMEEIDKIAKELLTVFVKEKIKDINQEVSKAEDLGDEQKVKTLRDNMAKLLAILPKNYPLV